MKTNIEKIDNFGRGITFIDNKITFVPKTLPGDVVDIELTNEKSKYNEASVNKIIAKSPNRIDSKCPFFDRCGGCTFLNTSYENSISIKRNKITDLLKRNKIETNDYSFIENKDSIGYRNKISLQVIDGKIGYFEEKTHKITKIDKCLLAKKPINDFIDKIHLFGIKNGKITIRCNYKEELLISIETDETIKNLGNDIIVSNNIVGIVLNGKCIYGKNSFIEKINELYFEISYDSFFQINTYITQKLFEIVSNNVKGNVLDLYCGVGTLSLACSKNANKVVGAEVVENAVNNAKRNAKLNNITNTEFVLQDLNKGINISEKFDTFILDPPRSGISHKIMQLLLKELPNTIVYVSCDPQTFVRDLNELKDKYIIKKIYSLDMFSYTYHCESVTVLERR